MLGFARPHFPAAPVLLDRAKNMSAHYDCAPTKQRYLAGGRVTSPFPLTAQVLAVEDRTPRELEERQQIVIGRLAGEWGMR